MDYRATDVSSLVHEIKTDNAVADRFERHFGMNRSELIAYLGATHRDSLRSSGVYDVYSIPEDGHVKMHRQMLTRGEPVFADSSGAPILLVKCGNPLTRGPALASENPGITPELAAGAAGVLGPGPIAATPGFAGPEMLVDTPKTPAEMVYSPVAPETLIAPVPEAAQPFSGIGGGGVGGGAAILPIVGGIIWGIGSSGGHHSPPVPEPEPIAALAVGLAGLAFRRHRKTRC